MALFFRRIKLINLIYMYVDNHVRGARLIMKWPFPVDFFSGPFYVPCPRCGIYFTGPLYSILEGRTNSSFQQANLENTEWRRGRSGRDGQVASLVSRCSVRRLSSVLLELRSSRGSSAVTLDVCDRQPMQQRSDAGSAVFSFDPLLLMP